MLLAIPRLIHPPLIPLLPPLPSPHLPLFHSPNLPLLLLPHAQHPQPSICSRHDLPPSLPLCLPSTTHNHIPTPRLLNQPLRLQLHPLSRRRIRPQILPIIPIQAPMPRRPPSRQKQLVIRVERSLVPVVSMRVEPVSRPVRARVIVGVVSVLR